MKSAHYLLSIIDHKSHYQLTDDVTIEIDKSFENNLRERNPQLGRVEVVPETNPLRLTVGDVVAVNHFTFYGDIGANKSFTLQEHFEHEGVKYFKATERQIFFRVPEMGEVECMPDYIICDYRSEPEEHFGVYFGERKWIECTHGEYAGKEVVTLKNAMYLITLGRENYYKVRKDEVVWANGVVGDNLLVKLLPEEPHSIFTLPTNNQTAIALSLFGEVMVGDVIQIYRNQGVDTPGGYCIPEHSIVGIWNEYEQYGQTIERTKAN